MTYIQNADSQNFIDQNSFDADVFSRAPLLHSLLTSDRLIKNPIQQTSHRIEASRLHFGTQQSEMRPARPPKERPMLLLSLADCGEYGAVLFSG